MLVNTVEPDMFFGSGEGRGIVQYEPQKQISSTFSSEKSKITKIKESKHCRMLVGLLAGHINLHYMLHKMRRGKIPSCRCGAEKETFEHILCECLALEKIRMHTLGFARMDPD